MNLQSIPLSLPGRQLAGIAELVNTAVISVVDSGWWLKGEQTTTFEEEFAAYCGVSFCLGVGNGTDGLELALRAAGARGGEVVTVANAGGYTTTALRLVDATPVYVDVEPAYLTLDVSAAIAAVTPDTRAIVATHLYGNVVDVDAIRAGLAAVGREDVMIIEDGSQAHGATLDGRRVGSMGDMAVFSFYPTKNLGALGDAGAVLCRDRVLYDELVALHQYGWEDRYRSKVPFGRNSRMDEIQAAVLRIKLPYLDEWNAERRRIADVYRDVLSSGGSRLVNDPAAGAVVHLAVLRTPLRDQIIEHLAGLRISTGIHFPILDSDQQSQQGLPQRSEGLAESRLGQDEILTIPCFPGMSAAEVDRVAQGLASHQLKVSE